MALPNRKLEHGLGLHLRVAGVDEAGRGCLAGPVVAAAVILPFKGVPRGLNDSKQLPASERERLARRLREVAAIGVGMASVEEIDRINILQASMLAMLRAVEALGECPAHVLVDGNRTPVWPYPSTPVIGGDGVCVSIAAASIIAKVTRDRLMAELAAEHPHYGWEQNAGYGTARHRQAIAAHGLTLHHRRSYRPVREHLLQREMAFD